MFLSEPILRAIHEDRKREIARVARERTAQVAGDQTPDDSSEARPVARSASALARRERNELAL